ncbi:ANTAR domain-containing protein [Streptomyces sp. NPDC006458]|uniref:ANTAR domain-containing protein n=1 Tax=Streptomyces sp. NPDC006458 TaxID=3154302 RepID=UPI0033A124BD
MSPREHAESLGGADAQRGVELSVRAVADGVDVLCLSGILDTDGAATLPQDLAPHMERAARTGRRLVLDLSDLRLVSAAAVQALDLLHTRHLDQEPVLVIASAAAVRELFTLAPPPGLRVHASLGAALAQLAVETPAIADPVDDAVTAREELRTEVFGLRTRARTGAVIGMAQGILLERYRLADSGAAFDLLRTASQRCNVPLRIVASAVVTAPAPTAGSAEWFPGRRPTPPPRPGLLGCSAHHMHDRKYVLRVLVYDAVTLSDADAGEVHLPDRALGSHLILEAQSGLDAAYRDHLALVSGTPALAARARERREPVFVADIADDVELARSEAGQAALAVGSRAQYAVPAMADSRECVGVIGVHRGRPGSWMTTAQRTALGILADDLAAWRSWYRRTVVLDALEHIHTCAVLPG